MTDLEYERAKIIKEKIESYEKLMNEIRGYKRPNDENFQSLKNAAYTMGSVIIEKLKKEFEEI